MTLSPLPLAVFVVDAEGAITSWNKGCEKLAGHTAADIRGSRLDHLIAFDDGAGRPPSIAERAESESTGVLRCVDGRALPVRVTVARQTLEPGPPESYTVIVISRGGMAAPRYALVQDLQVADLIEVLPCVFGTGLDISLRKQAEHGLRLRERAMSSSVNAIVVTCCEGPENHIEYVTRPSNR